MTSANPTTTTNLLLLLYSFSCATLSPSKLPNLSLTPSGWSSNTSKPSNSSPAPELWSPPNSNRLKTYHFTLTEGYCQPDNYRQVCFLINNQFPGPPIHVNQYDLLELTVVNQLSVPTALHFHGILQTHTLDADGVPYVTQDPILPNQTYVYRMQIEGQTGTYMYHGHQDLDLLWLHGLFIIWDNPNYYKALGPDYQYDFGYEHAFLLETIYHSSLEDLKVDILENGNDDPTIASLAINGLSYGPPNKSGGQAPGYEVINVVPGKKYRFRIINISMGSYFRFQIPNHSMEIIEMDGILIEPKVTDRIEINSGQRYSVLVTMNNTEKPQNHWISCTLMAGVDQEGPANGKAILHYPGAPNPAPLRKKLFLQKTPGLEPTLFDWLLTEMQPNRNYIENQVYPYPDKANRTIWIDMHFRTKNGPPRFLINGELYKQPNVTYLTRVRNGEDISLGDPRVFKIFQGEVIDLVFQNRMDDTGGCDQHPIHLHGHTMWIVTSGPDTIDNKTLPGIVEQQTGQDRTFRDVLTIFPGQTTPNTTSGAGCGWMIMRIVANNPGLWLVHCHITSHMMLGKMFTLYEVNPSNMELFNE